MNAQPTKGLPALIICIAVLASVAAAGGIFMGGGKGPYEYETIRGKTITISGEGLYRHMSADVAIQGIAQDYITLFLAVPLLLVFLVLAGKWGIRGRLLLAGLTGYFMVTYIFYLSMGMYNEFFLIYVGLASCSFFAFYLQIQSLIKSGCNTWYSFNRPSFPGWFLMVNAVAIGLMWLSVVAPPLFDGSLYPAGIDHYTTMIVQGFDLSVLLPASFIAGWLFVKRKPAGYLWTPVYLIFLSFLMTALTSKIIGMNLTGVETRPAIFIIPFTTALSIFSAWLALSRINEKAGDTLRP